MNKLRILHIATSTGKNSFGVGHVALNLASRQKTFEHRAEIWTCDSATEARELEEENHLLPNMIRTFPIIGPRRLAYSPAMERTIARHTDQYDVIHQHGIWTAISRVTNRWRVQTNKPTVIAPHGSLDAWALRRSIWKKRLALLLYERENLGKAACLHALSEREANGFREFGLKNPIAIIPNGISEKWLMSQGDGNSFRRRFRLSIDTRILLYLGRVTPIKNLPTLIRAISALRPFFDNWMLIIAGINEFGHQSDVESIVRKLSLEGNVQFVGPLFGQEKRDAFAAADLFVLPSYSEGSPVVILEALGAGVPVLATKASPWEEVVLHRCGWWVDSTEHGIRSALLDAIHCSTEELQEMGKRGKEMVIEKYTWTEVSKQTLELYTWLLGSGNLPAFVRKI